MKNNIYVMFVFGLLLSLFLFSCITPQSNGVKKDTEDKVVRDDSDDRDGVKRYSFGGDEEVQVYEVDNKLYYLVNTNKDIKDISYQDLKLYSIDANRVNIKKTTIEGADGIVLTFYDIKVFLEKTKSSSSRTKVGVFEPSSSKWIIGYDKDRDKNSMGFIYDGDEIGPITINRSGISRAYN